jgi:hypothetical protein
LFDEFSIEFENWPRLIQRFKESIRWLAADPLSSKAFAKKHFDPAAFKNSLAG